MLETLIIIGEAARVLLEGEGWAHAADEGGDVGDYFGRHSLGDLAVFGDGTGDGVLHQVVEAGVFHGVGRRA